MTVFTCVDDNYGIAFNNRRQSRDGKINNVIFEMTDKKTLYIDAYSKRLFEENKVTVKKEHLENASSGDFCFAERDTLERYDERINRLVLFKWNKTYPSDMRLEIDLGKRTLERTFDFEGSSHKIITCEVWVK